MLSCHHWSLRVVLCICFVYSDCVIYCKTICLTDIKCTQTLFPTLLLGLKACICQSTKCCNDKRFHPYINLGIAKRFEYVQHEKTRPGENCLNRGSEFVPTLYILCKYHIKWSKETIHFATHIYQNMNVIVNVLIDVHFMYRMNNV